MKILIPALALLSTTAMAADFKFGMEGRFDYANSTVKHEYATATNNYEEKRSEFYSNALRLNATATINDNLSARFRYRLSTAQQTAATSTQNRDLSFQNVDFFYVDHKTQWFTARLGKQSQADSLGREFYVAGTDYPTTQFGFVAGGAAVSTSGASAYGASNSAVYNQVKGDADLYRVGASLMFNQLTDQTFTVSVFNPVKSTNYSDAAAATNDAKNTKMGMGLYYNGKFADGLVQPTLGYTTFGIAPATGTGVTATPDASNKLISAGVRSQVAGVTFDVDWKQYKRDNTVANPTSSTNTEDKTTSIWTNVSYTWDNLTPFVNYINDKYSRTADVTTSVGNYKRTALSVGLQIKPYKESNFRYNVAYTSDVKKIDLAAASTVENKISANQISAGIKFDL